MSVVQRVFKGYNTFWAAVFTLVPAAFLVVVAFFRISSENALDILVMGAGCGALSCTVAAQLVVSVGYRRAKTLPPIKQKRKYLELINNLNYYLRAAGIAGVLLLVIAGVQLGDRPGAYPVAWGFALLSFGVAMLGVAMIYEEWRRTLLMRRVDNHGPSFRFAEWIHTTLTLTCIALALVAVVLFGWDWLR